MKKFRFLTLVLVMLLTQFLYNINESLADDEDNIIMIKSITCGSDSIWFWKLSFLDK